MLDENLIAEASRQFTICNACRYCEGICSVFPAMELRTAFEGGDITYLSTLCHDCRACVHACPFSPPHELAVDIPSLMATARAQTFEHYARPRAFWRLLTRPRSAWALAAIGIAFFALVAAATGDPARIVHSHDEQGSFYKVIAYLWLVVPGGIVSVLVAAAILAGGYRFAQETQGGPRRLLSAKAHGQAALDTLGLRNLRGGGGACYYPGDTASSMRRYLHHLVFYGFGAMFAATVAAAFEQELLGILPPYPLASVPVVLGTLGGLATLTGCLGFLVLGVRRRDARKTDQARQLDRVFTAMLAGSVITGLLTLALRATPLMGPMLILHLGVLGGLYLTFPYSKFVHWVYRYTALVRSHVELEPRERFVHGEPAPPAFALTSLIDAENLDG